MIAVETEMNHALHEAFHAAFILTGSCEGAALSVEASLGMISADFSREALLEETARAAVWCHTCASEPSPVLPQELQALFQLPSTSRYCFVMHVLMGFDLETCSKILRLSRDEVEEALYRALLDLPRVAQPG